LKITIICTDSSHPIYPALESWSESRGSSHTINLVSSSKNITCNYGDILFLISCAEVISTEVRARFQACFVIHASDLPFGRGWSPLIWQIIEGRSTIVVTLLEAIDQIDAGKIWAQEEISFNGTELYDEINEILFAAELKLMDHVILNFKKIIPKSQSIDSPTWYPRRTCEDSRIDPSKSIASQFDLLRVADPNRYPAFFELRGQHYEIAIRKKVKK
jgi:methionyl-tRNA formyltransferase